MRQLLSFVYKGEKKVAETLIGYYHPRGDTSTFKIGIVQDTLPTENSGWGNVEHALSSDDRSLGFAARVEPVATASTQEKNLQRNWFLLHQIKAGSVIILTMVDRDVTRIDRKYFLFNQGGVLRYRTDNQRYEEESGLTLLNINTVAIVDFDTQRVIDWTDWITKTLPADQVHSELVGYLKDFLYADNFDSGYEYHRWKQSEEIRHKKWQEEQIKISRRKAMEGNL